jgi:hypothetical protein
MHVAEPERNRVTEKGRTATDSPTDVFCSVCSQQIMYQYVP